MEEMLMTLAEKIIQRRKLLGMSQEELAEKLGVSRQSVSKWELGAAIPETDKIVLMSEIFGVSCDYLLKDGDTEPLTASFEREIGVSEITGYLTALVKKLRLIALGVVALILSPLALIMLSAALDSRLVSESVALGVGLTLLFVLAALGVALIVMGCAAVGAYSDLTSRSVPLSRSAQGIVRTGLDEGRARHTLGMVLAVVMCIMSVLPLILLGIMELPELAATVGIACMFVLVSAAVYIFITAGAYRSECETLANLPSAETAEKSKLKSAIEGIFWPIVVAAYLAVSFTSGRWDISWIIFLVAAALSGCIDAIVNCCHKNKS